MRCVRATWITARAVSAGRAGQSRLVGDVLRGRCRSWGLSHRLSHGLGQRGGRDAGGVDLLARGGRANDVGVTDAAPRSAAESGVWTGERGIVARHRSDCRARSGGPCSCRPGYQATVWSARDRKPVRKSFGSQREARGVAGAGTGCRLPPYSDDDCLRAAGASSSSEIPGAGEESSSLRRLSVSEVRAFVCGAQRE
jgi:hypothetical protein